MVPSACSAEKPTVSESVGCGWMVSAMSSASRPASIARTASASNSPALTPTIPAPSTRFVPGSRISFVRPSERPMLSARPEAAQGNPAVSNGVPSALAWVSVSPVQATSGSV